MNYPCALCGRERPIEEMTFSRHTRARYCAKCRKSKLQVHKPEPTTKSAKTKRRRLVTGRKPS